MTQNNKLKMTQATLGCLQNENNISRWTGVVGIVEAVASVQTTVDAILVRSL